MPPPPLLLLTRPAPAAQAFGTAVARRAGPVEAIVSPAFGIVPLDAPPLPDAARTLVFTSAAGVQAHLARGGRTDLPVLAVGAATADAARAGGMRADIAGPDADALVAALAARRPDGLIVHLHGAHRRGAVVERLRAAGLNVEGIALYDQPALPPTDAARAALRGARPVVVPLFSPRTAALLTGWPQGAPLLVAAMSEAVAIAASALHTRSLNVAAHPDADAMLALTVDLLADARKLEAGQAGV